MTRRLLLGCLLFPWGVVNTASANPDWYPNWVQFAENELTRASNCHSDVPANGLRLDEDRFAYYGMAAPLKGHDRLGSAAMHDCFIALSTGYLELVEANVAAGSSVPLWERLAEHHVKPRVLYQRFNETSDPVLKQRLRQAVAYLALELPFGINDGGSYLGYSYPWDGSALNLRKSRIVALHTRAALYARLMGHQFDAVDFPPLGPDQYDVTRIGVETLLLHLEQLTGEDVSTLDESRPGDRYAPFFMGMTTATLLEFMRYSDHPAIASPDNPSLVARIRQAIPAAADVIWQNNWGVHDSDPNGSFGYAHSFSQWYSLADGGPTKPYQGEWVLNGMVGLLFAAAHHVDGDQRHLQRLDQIMAAMFQLYEDPGNFWMREQFQKAIGQQALSIDDLLRFGYELPTWSEIVFDDSFE